MGLQAERFGDCAPANIDITFTTLDYDTVDLNALDRAMRDSLRAVDPSKDNTTWSSISISFRRGSVIATITPTSKARPSQIL